MDKKTPKFSWYLTTLIAIIGVVIPFLSYIKDNNRQLEITEYSIFNVHSINWNSTYDYNPYTEAFLHSFSDSYVQFHLENHSKSDIEFYGFYLQIQFPNFAHKRINIPLTATTKDEEYSINVFYSDWDAATYIEKRIIPSNTTIEFTSSLHNTCFDLSHLWFLDSGLTDLDHPISKVLEKKRENNESLDAKCRIVCKDTFGDFHYSDWITIQFSSVS